MTTGLTSRMDSPDQLGFQRFVLAATLFCLALANGCSTAENHTAGVQANNKTFALDAQVEQNYKPRPYTGKLEPDDGQWVRAAHDYASTRYSTLNQITKDNASKLTVAWEYDTQLRRGEEAAPIVVNNMMYVVTPWPNYLLAFDLTKPGPALKWKFDPKPSPASQGVACCDH